MSEIGNTRRCPSCHSLGTTGDGLCLRCRLKEQKKEESLIKKGFVDSKGYFNKMALYKNANLKAYQYALLEIDQKCKTSAQVPVDKRRYILTIMEKRIPLRDGGYQGKSNYANESNIFFKSDPISKSGFGSISDKYGYERKMT